MSDRFDEWSPRMRLMDVPNVTLDKEAPVCFNGVMTNEPTPTPDEPEIYMIGIHCRRLRQGDGVHPVSDIIEARRACDLLGWTLVEPEDTESGIWLAQIDLESAAHLERNDKLATMALDEDSLTTFWFVVEMP